MRITIVFDVEDYITPPDGGLDDLLKMLADVMTEERVSGTFFTIGEKVRCLRDRGRRDVLDALARHDVGSHVNMGSIHPTVTERAERAGWSDGFARMAADEIAGIDELGEILGRPLSSLARHGGSFCPQLVAALGRRGLPYVYSPAVLPGHHVTWYCNALNFGGPHPVFQEAYHARAKFLEAEKIFLEAVERRKGYDWMALFHSHPCRIKTKWFWDRNYFRGIHTPPEAWQVPEFFDEYSFEEVRENWAFHCRRLREDPDIRLGTIREFALEFGKQAESAGAAEILDLAQAAADAQAPFFTDRFSAAEILDLLARAYLHLAGTGSLPDSLPRRDLLGPTETPLSTPTARRLLPDALRRVARGIAVAVDTAGMLPSRLRCGEGTLGSPGEIGIGTALVALGRALASKDTEATIETTPAAPYPAVGHEIAANARDFRRWPCHREDLDMAQVCRLATLQSWTLKPAQA